jgi:hypothetical protein
LSPGEQHIGISDHVKAVEEATATVPTRLVAIEFADTNGARWLPDLQGKLTPA